MSVVQYIMVEVLAVVCVLIGLYLGSRFRVMGLFNNQNKCAKYNADSYQRGYIIGYNEGVSDHNTKDDSAAYEVVSDLFEQILTAIEEINNERRPKTDV